MLDVFNTPTPQGANYQEFYGGGTVRDWVKPRGVSMVRFMLIGAGGGGGGNSSTVGGAGGGSGAITSWIGPAIFIPDVLRVTVGAGGVCDVANGGATTIVYQAKDGIGYTLLTAEGGVSPAGNVTTAGAPGAASINNYFGAAGIFFSLAGQAGGAGSSTSSGAGIVASTSTFLCGGGGGAGGAAGVGGSVQARYGYPDLPTTAAGGTVKGADGYFQTQPILFGVGGAGGTASGATGSVGGNGGIGCGGGGAGEDANFNSRGGDGAVFIWSW